MTSFKIAPVEWYMGQTLLPDHFVAQEGALLSEMRLRAHLSGLPEFGVAQLFFNESTLAMGTLAIDRITAVLSDGVVVDYPRNSLLLSLSLAATGATRCSVYLHLLNETTRADSLSLYSDDSDQVKRVIFKAQISTQDAVENSRGMLKIGEFEKTADSKWRLSRDYIPPLLQVGPNPFLRLFLTELSALLTTFRSQLEGQLKDSFFGPAKLASIRLCLSHTLHLQSRLADIEHQVYCHPFLLYDAVRSFYLHLCAFQETLPEGDPYPYVHSDLGPRFGKMLRLIKDKISPPQARSHHKQFVLSEGIYKVAPLPTEVQDERLVEIYILVQRQNLHDKVSLEGVKLAAPGRLLEAHKFALKGVPFRYISLPNFPHSFGPDIDFYQVTTGEEWALAVKESALAFYNHPSLEKARGVFLYWRSH